MRARLHVCWRRRIGRDGWGRQADEWILAWFERGKGGGGAARVRMMEKCWIDMGAQWQFHLSPHHCLNPPPHPTSSPHAPRSPHTFPKAQTLPVVTLEYCRPGWSTPLLRRRMSAQARGSFDKQSIYWYMIKYARNHPTAEGYYSFNIIIWINKHSVEK